MAEDDMTQLLSEGDIESLLSQAQDNSDAGASDQASEGSGAARPNDASNAQPLSLSELAEPNSDPETDFSRIDLLKEVRLNVKIELGRTEMFVEDVLKLADGSVVSLDRLAGDPVDILVNDRLVAKGEVLVLNDNFCIRIAEILSVKE